MIYLDLTDLFYFSENNKHCTGIQRVTAELANIWQCNKNVKFVFCALGSGTWYEINKFPKISGSDLKVYNRFNNNWKIDNLKWSKVRNKVLSRNFLQSQKWLVRFILSKLCRPFLKQPIKFKDCEMTRWVKPLSSDDVFFVGSIPRNYDYYQNIISKVCSHSRVGFFLHDMIPLVCPEYCLYEESKGFERYIKFLGQFATDIVTSSANNLTDYDKYIEQNSNYSSVKNKIALGLPAGFTCNAEIRDYQKSVSPISLRLKSYKYCLVVGSIGPRKNHFELLQAWSKFYHSDKYDGEILVVAGSPWNRAQDIVDLLNSHYCGGSVIYRRSPSDIEIEYLYRNCQFTLTLSLYEGWGLPVSESIFFEKPAIVLNNSSLVDAGFGATVNINNRSIKEISNIIDLMFHNNDFYKSKVKLTKETKSKLPTWSGIANEIQSFFKQH